MIKKIRLIILVIICAIPMYSCGVNTKGWPHIPMPFERENLYRITLVHEKNDIITNWDTTNSDALDYLYTYSSYLYKEKKENVEKISKFYVKIDITFFIKNENIDQYQIIFYNQGVSRGYVVFNNEIHFLPGDVESLYKDFVKIIGEK